MTVLSGYFAEHLQELRRRVLACFLAVIIFTGAAYFFAENITRFLAVPLYTSHPGMGRLVYTNLTEAFITYLKVALLTGVVFSFPVLCYQIWMFVSPGLHQNEKRFALKAVVWGTLLFVCGAGFAYFVAMPQLLSFLLGFAGEELKALPKLDAYLTFVVRTSMAFGIAFEIPFLMIMATKGRVVGRDYFRKQRKYFYIAILILSFLLTVGDFLSTVLLAVPLFALYEAGILIIRLFSSPA